MDKKIKQEEIKNYVSKTVFNFRDLKVSVPEDVEPLGIDVGYGGVKVFSLNGMHSFPALLFRPKRNNIILNNDTDIRYIDEYGNMWYVGDRARDSLETGSRQIDSEEYFSEKRLYTDEFLILARVAIFLGLCKKGFSFLKNKKIQLCTGLPEEDVEKSSPELRKIISGHHHFEISIGDSEFTKVSFDISEDNIEILSQPQGTIYSTACDLQGNITREDLITDKNILILDGGMFTFDTHLSNRADRGISKTWEEFAMHEVYSTLRDVIYKKTERYINEYDIEKYISLSSVLKYKGNQKYYFGEDYLNIIKQMSNNLVRKLKRTYDDFNDIDIIIITGGTGKTYFPYLKELIPTDEIVLAESNTENNGVYNAIFSNVVGFFKFIMFLISLPGDDKNE